MVSAMELINENFFPGDAFMLELVFVRINKGNLTSYIPKFVYSGISY